MKFTKQGLVRKRQPLAFYCKGLLRQLVPLPLIKRQQDALLKRAEQHKDRAEIEWRVAYYHKLAQPFDASAAPRIANIERKHSRYFLDLDAHSKGFGPDRRLHYLFGDICHVPDAPTVVKSRPVTGNNENSVLMKLDQLRHFNWTSDPLPFRDKKPTAVWRGTPLTEERRQFVRMFYNHPTFDIGHSRHLVDDLPPKASLTHAEQKTYKFFVSLEGNDVATNLKWAMASNMLVFAPLPEYETWFMEGLLEAGKHFVPIKTDFSDFEDKVAYYSDHPEEAEEIIANAHAWVSMFSDPLKERIISMLVLQKYFALSGQL